MTTCGIVRALSMLQNDSTPSAWALPFTYSPALCVTERSSKDSQIIVR